MNLSVLITRIRQELGIYSIALPLEDVNGYIALGIKNTTLRTYSQYFPQENEVKIYAREIESIAYRNLEYVDVTIPLSDHEEVVEVVEVYYDASEISGVGYYGAGMPIFSPSMIEDVLSANIGANITNMMYPKVLFHFREPNKLRLYNFTGGSVLVRYNRLHDLSLASIPFSQEETFTKLAILDAMKYMYGIVKHWNDLETANGRVGLNISDWADAAQKREEVLKEWDDVFHLDRKTVYYA